MAYNELIKDINRIRPYIRDFYVFGLYTRNEYAARYGISPRSYDNERRRVESWLQEFLHAKHPSPLSSLTAETASARPELPQN